MNWTKKRCSAATATLNPIYNSIRSRSSKDGVTKIFPGLNQIRCFLLAGAYTTNIKRVLRKPA